MASALHSLIDAARLTDIERGAARPRTLFVVNIGARENPRFSYSVMARSAAEAVEDNLCLAHDGERVEAHPAGKRAECFAVLAERHALEAAKLRDAIPEAERIAADLARNVNKGAVLAARSDRAALEAQVLNLDAMRRAGW